MSRMQKETKKTTGGSQSPASKSWEAQLNRDAQQPSLFGASVVQRPSQSLIVPPAHGSDRSHKPQVRSQAPAKGQSPQNHAPHSAASQAARAPSNHRGSSVQSLAAAAAATASARQPMLLVWHRCGAHWLIRAARGSLLRSGAAAIREPRLAAVRH